jgi:hypothetical protein
MTSFDEFSSLLWEEAKRFYEKSIEAKEAETRIPFLHAAILLGMSSLEAYVNSICDDLLTNPHVPLHEQSILSEKELELERGEFRLSNKLQMFRLTDRIEFLFFRFGKVKLNGTEQQWYGNLKASIKLRNSIVHPKEAVLVTDSSTKLLLESVKDCLQEMSKTVYGKAFPFVKLGLQSKLTF